MGQPKRTERGVVAIVTTALFFWKIFETTGSVTAYLLYRRFCLQ
ncbi:MAG: YqzL family protein [Bacillota bacterium]